MRTKKGDWILACYNGFKSNGEGVRPWVGKRGLRVTYVGNGFCYASFFEGGLGIVRSWVRCADMREGGK